MNRVVFSSKTVEWPTPPALFDRLNAEFGFTLDVCATPGNAKCPRYFTPEADGLAQTWVGACWMNPPYGRDIGRWTAKAAAAAQDGATVVGLIPAKTETSWWHEHVVIAAEIRFIRGRLYFVGAAHNAPFPSAIVVWRPWRLTRPRVTWYAPTRIQRGRHGT